MIKNKIRKKHHIELKSVAQIMRGKLSKLEAELTTKHIEDLSKDFTRIIRQHFKASYNIDYEFTYEELLHELKKRDVDPALQKIVGSFFKRIPQIEFGGTTLDKQELQSLIEEMHSIVSLTAGTSESQEDLRKRLKKITVKGPSRIYQLISQAELHLRLGEVKEAMKFYVLIKREYDVLDDKHKKHLYDQVRRLFDEIRYNVKHE